MPSFLAALGGVSLGLLGAGGSIVTVPLLVGPPGVEARTATTMSLAIVGIAAAGVTNRSLSSAGGSRACPTTGSDAVRGGTVAWIRNGRSLEEGANRVP